MRLQKRGGAHDGFRPELCHMKGRFFLCRLEHLLEGQVLQLHHSCCKSRRHCPCHLWFKSCGVVPGSHALPVEMLVCLGGRSVFLEEAPGAPARRSTAAAGHGSGDGGTWRTVLSPPSSAFSLTGLSLARAKLPPSVYPSSSVWIFRWFAALFNPRKSFFFSNCSVQKV